MRPRLLTIAVVAALGVGLRIGAADEPEEIKVYLVRQATEPPRLDGRLDDPCWAAADVIDDFGYTGYFNQDRTLAIPATEARFLWDSRYLYIGLTAFEKDMAAVRRVVSNPGTAIYWRDLFEVHIDANHDRKTRYQFMANPNEEKYVYASFDRGWTIEYESAWGLWADWKLRAHYGTDRWTLEIAVSFADMEVKPRPGVHMGLNVARFRFVEGTQFLTWNGQGGSHHDLTGFATSILVGPERSTTVPQALRLAYPDVDQRLVRLLRRDGYTILDHGRAQDLSFAEVVRRQADQIRAQLDAAGQALAAAPLADEDKKTFAQQVEAQRRAIDQALAADKEGPLGYAACQKTLAALKPIAERAAQLTWQLKAQILADQAMR